MITELHLLEMIRGHLCFALSFMFHCPLIRLIPRCILLLCIGGTTLFRYSSFFVVLCSQDLDTVDFGIEDNLRRYFPDISAVLKPNSTVTEDDDKLRVSTTGPDDSWDVMISHFLGVDHIGHTHNAHHSFMTSRLKKMDKLACEVIKNLPPNSIFLLFGDHGMTNDGNHGGASELETDSVLFIYTNSEEQLDFDDISSLSEVGSVSSKDLNSNRTHHRWNFEHRQFIPSNQSARDKQTSRLVYQVKLC